MSNSNKTLHTHRILPGHMNGKYEIGNTIEVEVTSCNQNTANHVMWHYANWQLYGKLEDQLAYKGLAGYFNKEEIITQLLSIAGKKGGKSGGRRSVDLGVGAHAPGMSSRGGKVTGPKTVEEKIGIYGRSIKQHIEDSRKGGITQGQRNAVSGHMRDIARLSPERNKIRACCLKCGKETTRPALGRYHRNC